MTTLTEIEAETVAIWTRPQPEPPSWPANWIDPAWEPEDDVPPWALATWPHAETSGWRDLAWDAVFAAGVAVGLTAAGIGTVIILRIAWELIRP